MNQWYRLSNRINYNIAEINNKSIPKTKPSNKRLFRITNFDNLQNLFDFKRYEDSNPKPFKSAWYVEKRYFNHPIFSYLVYGILEDDVCSTILIFRKQELNRYNVLRLVDIIGNFDFLYSVTKCIDEIMNELESEYVDFYEVGMDSSMMEMAGWMLVNKSKNIIPNYFHPFVRKNIDIYYTSSDDEIRLFKADGDQDRPN